MKGHKTSSFEGEGEGEGREGGTKGRKQNFKNCVDNVSWFFLFVGGCLIDYACVHT